jgi:hypothetical protein
VPNLLAPPPIPHHARAPQSELGANAVLTQPPLDWSAYLAWLEDARSRGLLNEQLPTGSSSSSSGTATTSGSSSVGSSTTGPVRLIVGHPMVSSAANLSFWVSLAGCGGSAAARQLVADALRAEAGGKEAAAAHAASYNRKLVEQVRWRHNMLLLRVTTSCCVAGPRQGCGRNW